MDLDPISVELTYGLERICAFLQGVDSVYDLRWSATKPMATFGWQKSSSSLSTVSTAAMPRPFALSLSCTRSRPRSSLTALGEG